MGKRMTLSIPSKGQSLKTARTKKEVIDLISNILSLQPKEVVDLDDYNNLQNTSSAFLGIWLESWATLVEPIGFEQALNLLFIASSRLDNLLFCSENRCTNKAWLPEFIESERDIHLLFEASTCYKDIQPIAIYKNKVVYWGSNPLLVLHDTQDIDITKLRLLTAKKKRSTP